MQSALDENCPIQTNPVIMTLLSLDYIEIIGEKISNTYRDNKPFVKKRFDSLNVRLIFK